MKLRREFKAKNRKLAEIIGARVLRRYPGASSVEIREREENEKARVWGANYFIEFSWTPPKAVAPAKAPKKKGAVGGRSK